MNKRNKPVVCVDTYQVSVQAGEGNYCSPRDDIGPYTHVELGYPSMHDPLLDGYAEDRNSPTTTVYGWVPSQLVELLIIRHGGAISGEVPDGVHLFLHPHKEENEKQ